MERKPAVNRVQMIGNIYNYWKVIEVSHCKNKIVYYKCECLRCNNTFTVDGRNIRNGLSKMCKDCGHRETNLKNTGIPLSEDRKKKISSARVCKELEDIYPEINAKGGLIISTKIDWMKASAKTRKYTWNLTKLQVAQLITKPCHYCGDLPDPYHGLDRVDNSKGYEIDNVVTCCKHCNSAKLERTEEEFKSWIVRLYKNLIEIS